MSGHIHDPEFRKIIKNDLHTGCHNNHTDKPEYFTEAYFQHPDELHSEMKEASFKNITLAAIEGLLWASKDFQKLKTDASAWEAAFNFMRSVENDHSIIGISPHIMGIGVKQ